MSPLTSNKTTRYILDKVPKESGYLYIHNLDKNCENMPPKVQQINLGRRANCNAALKAAKLMGKHYAIGCPICCPECFIPVKSE